MKKRVGTIASVTFALLVAHVFGYTLTPWSYKELFAKSDFVVIASPLTRPRDTNERMSFPVSPPMPVIGVSTEFKTLLVLKGSKRQRFILHHYREARKADPNKVIIGGPPLPDFASDKRYLLFLVREADGRFAPVSEQRDASGISVQELGGITVDD
jgi:hypothetical protein